MQLSGDKVFQAKENSVRRQLNPDRTRFPTGEHARSNKMATFYTLSWPERCLSPFPLDGYSGSYTLSLQTAYSSVPSPLIFFLIWSCLQSCPSRVSNNPQCINQNTSKPQITTNRNQTQPVPFFYSIIFLGCSKMVLHLSQLATPCLSREMFFGLFPFVYNLPISA